MSRHSVEIKALLESKRLSKSKFNPESSVRYLPESRPQSRNLKRSQSSSSLRRKGSPCEMSLIEDRFRKLEHNYRTVLEETRVKAQLFNKQKQELEKCQMQRERDRKEIQRLRSMLGFTQKVDQGSQCEPAIQSRSSYDRQFSKISTYSKAEQSTEAGLRETNESWKSRSNKRSTMRGDSRRKTPQKVLYNKSETTIGMRTPMKESKVKSPLSKYKFIPSLVFN